MNLEEVSRLSLGFYLWSQTSFCVFQRWCWLSDLCGGLCISAPVTVNVIWMLDPTRSGWWVVAHPGKPSLNNLGWISSTHPSFSNLEDDSRKKTPDPSMRIVLLRVIDSLTNETKLPSPDNHCCRSPVVVNWKSGPQRGIQSGLYQTVNVALSRVHIQLTDAGRAVPVVK